MSHGLQLHTRRPKSSRRRLTVLGSLQSFAIGQGDDNSWSDVTNLIESVHGNISHPRVVSALVGLRLLLRRIRLLMLSTLTLTELKNCS